jgi:hypothetical protein
VIGMRAVSHCTETVERGNPRGRGEVAIAGPTDRAFGQGCLTEGPRYGLGTCE